MPYHNSSEAKEKKHLLRNFLVEKSLEKKLNLAKKKKKIPHGNLRELLTV